MKKENVKKLRPFQLWTLQNFPFIEADFDVLTNYEMMCKIVEYLNNVIENSNKQNSVINEYTNVVEELETWFDNLDLQEEVDTKLDEMAESGQLTDIIAQYLNLAGVLAYNTLADLKSAENIVNGSICRTLGKVSYDDGYGYYYKIRQITTGDVIDEDNIVSLSVSNLLIAEKIVNYNAVKDIVLDVLEDDPYITLFVGDSYGVVSPTNWVTKYCSMKGLTLGTNAYNLCSGGAGFHDNLGGSNTYLAHLTSGTSSIDKTKVNKIIVCGGWNDRQLSRTELATYTSAFMTYVKNNFPNAKVYCGMIANNGSLDPYLGTEINYREWLVAHTLIGYRTIEDYGGIYLDGVENIMHKYSLFNTTDFIHPNSDGGDELGVAIYDAVETGNCMAHGGTYDGIELTNSNVSWDTSVSTGSKISLYGYVENNIYTFRVSGSIAFSSYKAFQASDEYIDIELGTYTTAMPRFRYINYMSTIPLKFSAEINQQTYLPVYDGLLNFTKEGKITLRLYNNRGATLYVKGLHIVQTFHSKPLLMI